MVTPETSGPDETKRPRAGAVAMGLLGVAAGMAAIVALTQPDPPPTADATTIPDVSVPTVATPSTTTTVPPFRVADIVSGPQIEWVGSESFVGRRIVSVVPKDGAFYAFTTDLPDENSLDAWVSQGATEWEHLGSLDADSGFAPFRVIQGGPGFVAFGTDPDDHPMVWLSSDAREWEAAEVPQSDIHGHVSFSGGATATMEMILIAAEEWGDPARDLVSRAVAERYPGFQGSLAPGPDGEGYAVDVIGPLGLMLPTHRLEDFDLDADDLKEDFTSRFIVYVGTSDGRSWSSAIHRKDDTATNGFVWLSDLLAAPDGRILARGFDSLGHARTYSTSDGTTWEDFSSRMPDVVTTWEGRYVGFDWSDRLPRVRASGDLEVWEPLGPPEIPRWPWCCMDWGAYSELAAGPAGVAVTAATGLFEYIISYTYVERDGYRLEVGRDGVGPPVLSKGNTMVANLSNWESEAERPLFRLDGNGSVVFQDRATGDDLVSFTIEELHQLERAWMSGVARSVGDSYHLLFFSPDGEDWSIQDLSTLVSTPATIRLVIGDDRILLLAEQPNVTVVWAGIPPQADDY